MSKPQFPYMPYHAQCHMIIHKVINHLTKQPGPTSIQTAKRLKPSTKPSAAFEIATHGGA